MMDLLPRHFRSCRILTFAGAVLFLALRTTAQETVLYDIDFSAPKHTLNAPPARGGSNGISMIRFGSPTVVSEFGPLTDRPLLFTGDGDPYDQISLNGAPSTAIYRLEFDLVTENLKSSGFKFTIFFDSPEAYQFSLSGTLNRIDRIGAPTWEEGKAIHFSVTVNYATNRWTASMDDVVIFDSTFNGTELRTIRFSLGPQSLLSPINPAVKVAIDNVRVLATAATALNAPASLSALTSDRVINLAWPSVPFASSYQIFRGETAQFSSAALLTEHVSLFYSDQTVSAGRPYYYWVKAKVGDLLSPVSPSASAIVSLLPPVHLSVTTPEVGKGIRLVWPASPHATHYIIFRNTENYFYGSSALVTIPGLTHVDATALPGLRYFYWVRSATEFTMSQGHASGNGLSGLLPVTGLGATRDPAGPISLSWDTMTEAHRYTVFRSSTGAFVDAVALGETVGTHFTDSTSLGREGYSYWVIPESIEGIRSAPFDPAQVFALPPLPDLWITRSGVSPVGKGIVDLYGIGQSTTSVGRERSAVAGEIELGWLSAEVDEVRISGSRGSHRIDVHYRFQGNVTAEVMAGRFILSPENPYRTLRVSVEPKESLNRSRLRVSKSVLVRGVANRFSSASDAVILNAVSRPLTVPEPVEEIWVRPDPSERL